MDVNKKRRKIKKIADCLCHLKQKNSIDARYVFRGHRSFVTSVLIKIRQDNRLSVLW
jgi:hypothetical protein